MNNLLIQKKRKLEQILEGMDSAVVAFSGGTDSSFLLKCAFDILGERVIAVTEDSPIISREQLDNAIRVAGEIGVEHIIMPIHIMSVPEFVRNNNTQRCYYCKLHCFTKILGIAKERGINNVLDGSNSDDNAEERPGMKALRELGVSSPLREAGLSKLDIRELSKRAGVSTWDLPSDSCLASRVPYGSPITRQRLKRIENSESILRRYGFSLCRVRDYDLLARIEIDTSEFDRFLDKTLRKILINQLKGLGYTYITLDIEGFRSGSMNLTR